MDQFLVITRSSDNGQETCHLVEANDRDAAAWFAKQWLGSPATAVVFSQPAAPILQLLSRMVSPCHWLVHSPLSDCGTTVCDSAHEAEAAQTAAVDRMPLALPAGQSPDDLFPITPVYELSPADSASVVFPVEIAENAAECLVEWADVLDPDDATAVDAAFSTDNRVGEAGPDATLVWRPVVYELRYRDTGVPAASGSHGNMWLNATDVSQLRVHPQCGMCPASDTRVSFGVDSVAEATARVYALLRAEQKGKADLEAAIK